jgi:hypothetical protein
VLSGKVYPDGCVPTGWKIDLHLPDPRYEKGFEGDAFIAQAHFTSYTAPYWIPYRCLYSRNVPNLFMAGRDISVTHEALGTVRVMRTGGCMGEIVGMAASLCQQHTTDPRGVWEKHLEDLLALMRRGVGKTPPAPAALNPPAWLEKAGPNLARTATVTVSGNLKADSNPPELLNDGRLDVADNDGRWLSEARAPSWAEFSWTEPQTLSAARIVSGYSHDGDTVSDPIQAFVIEYLDGQDWREIPATRTSDNVAVEWQAQFPPVTATRLRLQITQTKIDVARIWEIELYNVPAEKPD